MNHIPHLINMFQLINPFSKLTLNFMNVFLQPSLHAMLFLLVPEKPNKIKQGLVSCLTSHSSLQTNYNLICPLIVSFFSLSDKCLFSTLTRSCVTSPYNLTILTKRHISNCNLSDTCYAGRTFTLINRSKNVRR